jgi:hypothetical protein
MASELSTYAALYDAAATTRIGGPSESDRVFKVCLLTDLVTLTEAANATGDYYDLGPANFDGQVVPNECFLSYDTGSTGTLSTTFTISSYDPDTGTVTDLTGLATGNGLVADYFADFAAATTWPTVTKDMRLRLYLTTATTATAGRTIRVNVAFIPKHV